MEPCGNNKVKTCQDLIYFWKFLPFPYRLSGWNLSLLSPPSGNPQRLLGAKADSRIRFIGDLRGRRGNMDDIYMDDYWWLLQVFFCVGRKGFHMSWDVFIEKVWVGTWRIHPMVQPRLSQTRAQAMSPYRWEPSQVALALIRRPKARAESGSTDAQNRSSRVSSVMR